MADAAEMLSGINSHLFVVRFALLISWATIRLHYHEIANVLKWLVLVLFAYPITAFVVGADWGGVARATVIPSMPHSRDEWSTLVAILGTTISPYLFFWQASAEVEEEKSAGQSTLAQRRGATSKELELRNIDVGVGAHIFLCEPRGVIGSQDHTCVEAQRRIGKRFYDYPISMKASRGRLRKNSDT